MKTFSAAEAKNHFGVMLESVQREPVRIEKNGRPVAVVLSQTEYEKLAALFEEAENAYWVQQAKEGHASGYIGTEAGEQLLHDLLNAKD